MSEIKIAIKTLESLNLCGNCTTGAEKEGGCAACERKLTKDLAIQALQEKQEREPLIEALKWIKKQYDDDFEPWEIPKLNARNQAIYEKLEQTLQAYKEANHE